MEKCIIIYDCQEELAMGCSTDKNAYPFTDNELVNEFVKNWNKGKARMEKAKDEENKYYGQKDMVYWLEIDYEGVLNPSNIYPD